MAGMRGRRSQPSVLRLDPRVRSGPSRSGDGQFLAPFDLGVDAAGNVYVLDDALLRLSKFAPDGAFEWVVDGKSDKLLDGHLHSAKVDSNGRIVVTIDEARRVVYLDPNGKVVDSFSTTVQSCEVSVDPFDNAYVSGAACLDDKIEVYDPSHVLIGSWSGSTMPLAGTPEFGPNGEILALDRVGALVSLKVTLPPR